MNRNPGFIFLFVLTAIVMAAVVGCKTAPSAPVIPTNTAVISPTLTATTSATLTSTVSSTFTITDTITETSTSTPTFTVTSTATATITPDNSSKIYDFETNTLQGWQKDAGTPAAISLVVTSTLAQAGTYSAVAVCAYSASNDLVRIQRSFAGTPVYLRNASVSAFMYVSATMFASGTFHPEMTLTTYDGTILPAITNPDVMSSGWVQAVFAVPDTQEYEMIGDVRIGLKNDLPTAYNENLYFDNISW